jgi:uncharacterized protein (TIGR03435 family)
MKYFIQVAYGVENQVTGRPPWLTTDWYVIEAKTDKTAASKEETTTMLRSLLAEHFKLRVRQETKEFEVYELVVNKTGRKSNVLADQEDPHRKREITFVCGMTDPAQLTKSLNHIVRRQAIEKTGIEGRYQFLLDFEIRACMDGTPLGAYDSRAWRRPWWNKWVLRLLQRRKPSRST